MATRELRGVLRRGLFAVVRRLVLLASRRPGRASVARDGSVLRCCIGYNRYGGYCVPLSAVHRPAARKILLGAVHEPDTIDLIVENVGEGDVVHAGTFFGDFLPPLSRALHPGARLWAFEPNPESFRCASVTILINDLRNVVLTPAALGERRGRVLLEVSDESGVPLGGASRVVAGPGRGRGRRTLEVETVPLDSVIPPDRTVSVIHLDVEGFEGQALAGALETIRRCRPLLILEKVPGGTWFRDHILRLGYRATGLSDRNAIFACGGR